MLAASGRTVPHLGKWTGHCLSIVLLLSSDSLAMNEHSGSKIKSKPGLKWSYELHHIKRLQELDQFYNIVMCTYLCTALEYIRILFFLNLWVSSCHHLSFVPLCYLAHAVCLELVSKLSDHQLEPRTRTERINSGMNINEVQRLFFSQCTRVDFQPVARPGTLEHAKKFCIPDMSNRQLMRLTGLILLV